MFLAVLLASFVAFVVYHFCWKRRGLPPGPTPWPLLGNLPGVIAKAPGYDAFKEWSQKYGPVFTYWYGRNPVVIVTDFEIINDTFIRDAQSYTDRFLPSEIHTLYRDGEWGIIDTSGPLWVEHRRFALRTLRDLGMGKNLMEQRVLAEISSMLDEVRKTNGDPIDLDKYLDQAVGSIINCTLLGHRFDESNIEEFRELRRLLENQSRVLNHPSFLLLMLAPSLRSFPYLNGAWKTILDCRDSLFDFMRKQVLAHEAEIDFSIDQESEDLCVEYLRERRRRVERDGDEGHYSMKQLVNLLYDLWIGGLETTTGNTGWAIVFILHNPHVQVKMRKEMEGLLGKGDSLVRTEHRSKLPYCSAVLMELQRCANILPSNLPRTVNKDVVIGGFKVKAGTAVIPQISSVLWDEKVFPEPTSFKPERFIDSNGQVKSVDEWLPFSIGARRCPGESLARMELFLFLTNIVRHFEIVADESAPLPSMTKTATTVTKPEAHTVRLIPVHF